METQEHLNPAPQDEGLTIRLSGSGEQALRFMGGVLDITPEEALGHALGLYLIAVRALTGPGNERLRLAVVNPDIMIVHSILTVGGINKPSMGLVGPNGQPL